MWYSLSRHVVRTAYRVLWPTTVSGIEHIPVEGPIIIASNHLAFMDSIIIPMLAPRPVSFLAKASYFTGKGLRGRFDKFFFTAVAALPVDREHQKSAQASLEQGAKVLREGRAFGIYPEGTRSRDGRLHRGRTGVAWLALKENVAVVPTGIVGTNRAQDIRNNRLRPFVKLSVTFGEPIHPDAYRHLPPAKARREMTDDIMAAIAAMSGQPRAAGYAPIGGEEAQPATAP